MGSLAGCAPEPPAEPEQLTASEAGGVYLDAVCPVNAAWDRVDLEVDRLRLAVGRGEGDTAALADEFERLGAASGKAAKELDPEANTWPKGAEAPVERVRKSLIADEKQTAKAAKLDAEDLVGYAWPGADEAAGAAAEARAALGLPADAESACAQWAEQQAKQQTEKKSGKSESGSNGG